MPAKSQAVIPFEERPQLIRYEAMCTAIAEAHAVDEVKSIRDKARAIEAYQRLAHNREAEDQAREIRIRSERRAGQLLQAVLKAKGSAQKGVGRAGKVVAGMRCNDLNALAQQKTLADLGISGRESHDWQKMATVPDEVFEQAVRQPKATTSKIVALALAEPGRTPGPVGARALWLWGTLMDFEREGLLDADPNELMGSMLEHMRETTKDMAPRVAAWLWRIKT